MLATAGPSIRTTPAIIDLATPRTAMDSVEATRRVTANSAAAIGDGNQHGTTNTAGANRADDGPCSLSIS